MKKEILAVLAIIAGFALIQTVKLGGWNGDGGGRLLIQADDVTFTEKLDESGEWTLVKFWAPWCEACRTLMPRVTEIAEERREFLTVITVNTDEAKATSAKFAVRPIPCLLLMQNGKEVDRMVGVFPKSVLLTWIDGIVARETAGTS